MPTTNQASPPSQDHAQLAALTGAFIGNQVTPKSQDPAKLADFILFSQRVFLLNLSQELNRENISFAQFFLLSYLANARELTMTDIARKMAPQSLGASYL
jgi:hypothetical protein